MYCIRCGNEIPEKSKYCPFCGKLQNKEKSGNILLSKVFKYKLLLLVYLVWCLIHIGLFLFSKPYGNYKVSNSNWSGGDFSGGNFSGGNFGSSSAYHYYDKSSGFYPFDDPLSSVIQGKPYWFHPIENINVYDISELFFYTILLPSLVILLVVFWKKFRLFINTYLNQNPQSRISLLLYSKDFHFKTISKKCLEDLKKLFRPNSKLKIVFGVVFVITCLFYYHAKIFNQKQEESVTDTEQKNEKIYTLLSTGNVPYFRYYGYTLSCDECSGVKVTAPKNSDVIVIVKKDNELGEVVGNVYISAGDSYKIGLKMNGIYQTFFYFGEEWNPQKDMGNGIKGGFDRNEYFSKDNPQNIENCVLSYVLQLQHNGNFNPQISNRKDIFKR